MHSTKVLILTLGMNLCERLPAEIILDFFDSEYILSDLKSNHDEISVLNETTSDSTETIVEILIDSWYPKSKVHLSPFEILQSGIQLAKAKHQLVPAASKDKKHTRSASNGAAFLSDPTPVCFMTGEGQQATGVYNRRRFLQSSEDSASGVSENPSFRFKDLTLINWEQVVAGNTFNIGMDSSRQMESLNRRMPGLYSMFEGSALHSRSRIVQDFFSAQNLAHISETHLPSAVSLIGSSYASKAAQLNQLGSSSQTESAIADALRTFVGLGQFTSSPVVQHCNTIRFVLQGHFTTGADKGRFPLNYRTRQGSLLIPDHSVGTVQGIYQAFIEYIRQQVDASEQEVRDFMVSILAALPEVLVVNPSASANMVEISMIPHCDNMEIIYMLFHGYFMDTILGEAFADQTEAQAAGQRVKIDINKLLAHHLIPLFNILSPWMTCNETTLYHMVRFYQILFNTNLVTMKNAEFLSGVVPDELQVTLDSDAKKRRATNLGARSLSNRENRVRESLLYREANRSGSESELELVDIDQHDNQASPLDGVTDDGVQKSVESSEETGGETAREQ